MENENEDAGGPMERAVPPPPPSQAKQPRFDLDDKFGKFEIKNLPHCKLEVLRTRIRSSAPFPRSSGGS